MVTGGAGFIGSMLCRKLVEAGREVVVLDNLVNGRRELVDQLGPRARLIVADIRDEQAVNRAVGEALPRVVVHLAAIHFIPYCIAHPQESIAVNVTGTLNVLEACRVAQTERVVVASTAAVYPVTDQPNRETDPVGPVDIYGITKYTCELLAELYVRQTSRPCTAARIFNAVGSNETNPHLVPALVEQLNRGSRRVSLGNLEPYRDYIDTQDLAEGLIALIRRPASGFEVFNVGSGNEYTVRQVVRLCEEILGESIRIEQRPDLVRKVERMRLAVCIDKLSGQTAWGPRISLRDTLRHLLNRA